MRTWHVQLAIFWVATSFVAAGIFLAPMIARREPKHQGKMAYALLGALAELRQAQLHLARIEVRASLAGTVSRLPKPGQYVAAGATAAALVADAAPWIEANFPEKDLTHVRPGQPVEIRIDT